MQYKTVRFGVLLLLAGQMAAKAQAPTYDIKDLGVFDGTYSHAFGINNTGQVVGASSTDLSSSHAFLYSNGSMTDLGNLGRSPGRPDKDQALAFAINDSGQIVGSYSYAPYGTPMPGGFLYSNGTMQAISLFQPLALNNLGQAVGYTYNTHAALYSNGVTTELNLLTDDSLAVAVNNLGQIAGSDGINAFLYQNGVEQILPHLAAGQMYEGSYAEGINDLGQVVGASNVSATVAHAVMWQNGKVYDLGTPGGSCAAIAINKYSTVVGSYSLLYPANQISAFVYQNGQMRDLFTGTDWQGGTADAINDRGQIVGAGYRYNYSHAYLATPYYSVSGTVALDGVDDAGVLFSEPFTFTLTPKAGSKPIVQTQVLSTGGAFSLSHVPFGEYRLSVKGSKWLSARMPVSLTTWGVSGLKFALLGGDANGDNKVDIADFGVLVNAFNGDVTVPDSGYDAAADFNCDGVVDIGDFGILVNNYNASGQ